MRRIYEPVREPQPRQAPIRATGDVDRVNLEAVIVTPNTTPATTEVLRVQKISKSVSPSSADTTIACSRGNGQEQTTGFQIWLNACTFGHSAMRKLTLVITTELRHVTTQAIPRESGLCT